MASLRAGPPGKEISGPAHLAKNLTSTGYSAFAHCGNTWASHLWEAGVGPTISVALPAMFSGASALGEHWPTPM